MEMNMSRMEDLMLRERCGNVAVDANWIIKEQKEQKDSKNDKKIISNIWTRDELKDLKRRKRKGRPVSVGTLQRMFERKRVLKERHKAKVKYIHSS
jgi:hypothetical protein